MTLMEVRGVAPNLETGKKWSPPAETLSAMSNKAKEASASEQRHPPGKGQHPANAKQEEVP